MKIQSINPSTGELIKEFESASVQDVTKAVEKARMGQKKWGSLPKKDRIDIVSNLKDVIKKRKQEVIDLIHEEAGMPKNEIDSAYEDILIGFDTHIKDYENIKTLDYSDDMFDSKVYFIPHGVVGHIGIWNYPFWQTMVTTIPALLTGNSIVYKPSEYVTMTGLKIAEMIHEAGIPDYVYITLMGGEDIGRAIVRSNVDMISFTGGIDTGLEIIRNAGIKPLNLELGGNDPAIVCTDCDVDQTVKGILWGTFLHGGQVCIRIKRVYVVKDIADEFIERLVNETKKLKIGKDISPLIRESERQKVHRKVQDAISKGAKLLTGGKIVEGKGFFYEPTILLYDNDELEVVKKETFGPVCSIRIVENEDEAIKLANNSSYGLGGSVWTKDIEKGSRIAEKMETGNVWINDSNVSIPCGVYWGGIKNSGIASAQNRIMIFLKKKVVITNKNVVEREWWYPYE